MRTLTELKVRAEGLQDTPMESVPDSSSQDEVAADDVLAEELGRFGFSAIDPMLLERVWGSCLTHEEMRRQVAGSHPDPMNSNDVFVALRNRNLSRYRALIYKAQAANNLLSALANLRNSRTVLGEAAYVFAKAITTSASVQLGMLLRLPNADARGLFRINLILEGARIAQTNFITRSVVRMITRGVLLQYMRRINQIAAAVLIILLVGYVAGGIAGGGVRLIAETFLAGYVGKYLDSASLVLTVMLPGFFWALYQFYISKRLDAWIESLVRRHTSAYMDDLMNVDFQIELSMAIVNDLFFDSLRKLYPDDTNIERMTASFHGSSFPHVNTIFQHSAIRPRIIKELDEKLAMITKAMSESPHYW